MSNFIFYDCRLDFYLFLKEFMFYEYKILIYHTFWHKVFDSMSVATFNKIIRFKKMKIENISKFIYNILKYNFISFDKKKWIWIKDFCSIHTKEFYILF